MNKSIFKGIFLLLAFITLIHDNANAQATKASFEVSFLDPSSSKYFRGNAQVVINHEEQYSFADFKKAAKKNKLLIITTKDFPKNAFKPGSTLGVMEFTNQGKSLKLHDVRVKKNKQKGNKRQIEISYKRVK